MEKLIIPLVAALFGVAIFYASFKDLDGFFETRKVRRLVAIIGRKATRVLYMVIGIALMGMAGFMAFGLLTGQVTV